MCVTLEGLRMVSDRIVDFRFFIKFDRSEPAMVWRFWTITEHVSYPSKKLLIKQNILPRWWLLLCKNYGWFPIEFSIFDFWSNFTGPDLQKIFCFCTITEHVSYSKKLLITQNISSWRCVLLLKDYGWFLIELLFFVKFHKFVLAITFSFWTITEHVCYA